jgi:hypothetical protein
MSVNSTGSYGHFKRNWTEYNSSKQSTLALDLKQPVQIYILCGLILVTSMLPFEYELLWRLQTGSQASLRIVGLY